MIKHTITAALAILLATGTAHAQSRIPFTVETGANRVIPLGEFDDLVDAGFSFSAAASVQVRPGIGVYASFTHAVFGPRLVSEGNDAIDQGVSVGVTAAIPTGTTRVQPYVAAGVVAHQLTLFDAVEADEDVGFEVGAGAAVPLIWRLRLTPSVSYRSYNVEPRFGDSDVPQPADGGFTVRYVSAGVGLNLAF